ncbi:MAG TPA: NUDIX domain-containing protein [Vicinamibacteria bacterium]|nr:NUDIX domain-containing protein [Vicinamibacteria bacterium]
MGRAALLLVSGAALLFELALVRLASVLLYASVTYLVVAGCVAGLGLGAALAARSTHPRLAEAGALLFCVGGLLALAACARTPFGFPSGLFILPFIGAGALAGTVYARLDRARLTYAADVLGGALGALAAAPLLRELGDVDLALVALVAGGAALVLFAPARISRAAGLSPLLALALNAASGPFAVDPFATFGFTTHLVLQTRDRGGRVVETAWDGLARTDLVATDEPWVRYLFTDRMYTARIARWDGRAGAFAEPDLLELSRLKGLAFRALQPERVLVLGAGGGFDVALALQAGASRVDAVEVNAAMVRMTRAQGDYAGRVFDRPEVAVHVAEARRFVRGARGAWNLISLSLMQTEPAVDRGNTGFQSWVFTAEAVDAYLERLAPGGVLAIVQNTEPVAEKTVATAQAAFARRGLATADADARSAVFTLAEAGPNPFAWLVLIGREPLAAATREALREAAVEARAIERPLAGLAEAATDERPFFYDVHPARPLVHLLAGGGAAALLLLLHLRDRASGARQLSNAGWLTAVLLGAAFLLAESALLSRAQFLLGSPPLAAAAAIGGMLAAAGAAALLFGRRGTPRRRLALAAALAAVAAALHPPLWSMARSAAGQLETAGLLASALALAASVAVPAGVAFPAAVQVFGHGRSAALFYGVNAIAAVVGGALASGLAPVFGIGSLFGVAGVCWAVAAAAAFSGGARRARALAPGLLRHVPADAREAEHLGRILRFIEAHEDPLDRRIPEGHLTGSAIVVSAQGDRVLLLHHRKLSRWLQPGGHADPGEALGEAVALREAREETGIEGLALLEEAPRPLDVDIHAIPARGDEPAHEHLDLRYLVTAPDGAAAQLKADESHAVRWFTWDELADLDLDPGLKRALQKAKRVLGEAACSS